MNKFLVLFTLVFVAKESTSAAASVSVVKAAGQEEKTMTKQTIEKHTVLGKTYTYTLRAPAEESKTEADVYEDEYGVVVLVKGHVADKAISFADQFGSARIIPHITLGQGRYPGKKFDILKEKVKGLAAVTSPSEIILEDHVVKYLPSGDTFWNLADSTAVNKWNAALCESLEAGFTEPMWQIAVDPTADKDLVLKYGRDFNVPGHNNPHITVAYGKQDDAVIKRIKESLAGKTMKYMPVGFAIARIDSVGNIVEVIEEYMFS